MTLRKMVLFIDNRFRIANDKRKRITRYRYIKSKPMQNPDKHGESLKQHILTVAAISALGALAAGAVRLDQYIGNHEVNEDTEAEPEMIFHHQAENDETLVLLGGLCMATDRMAKRCKTQLAPGVSLVAPIWPETGFNKKITLEKTWQHIEQTKPNKIHLGSISMGGPLGLDFLDHGLKSGRQELVEKVVNWGIIGSPMYLGAVRHGPRELVELVDRFGYSYVLNHSRPLLRRWNLNSIANAPSTKIVPQCKYLASQHAARLPIMPQRVLYVRGKKNDPVVDEDGSIKYLEQKHGLIVEQPLNEDWEESEHARTDKASLWFLLSQFGIAKPIAPVVIEQPRTPLTISLQQSTAAA